MYRIGHVSKLSAKNVNDGSFTFVKFVSKTVIDSDMKWYLPWPPWVMQQEIETILSVSCHPRWPRQEQW